MAAGKYPHVEWLDLKRDGTVTECAVMKKDNFGNVHFIALTELDHIDKQRMASILTSRNANTFELWDLMSQVTLGNGINALNYFHQYVKTRTANGRIITPQEGIIGAPAVGRRVAGEGEAAQS